MKKIISKQLQHPSGLIGRYLLPRIWNKRNRALNDFTLPWLHLQPDDRVLEIGCGGGYLLGQIMKKIILGQVVGVDASAEIIQYCSARFNKKIRAGKLELRCATVTALPYPDGHFSKICSVNSIFYWPDLSDGIREIYRVLTSHGLLVLTFTSKQDLDQRGFSPDAVRSYEDKDVMNVLQKQGFHDLYLEKETDQYRTFSVVGGRR